MKWMYLLFEWIHVCVSCLFHQVEQEAVKPVPSSSDGEGPGKAVPPQSKNYNSNGSPTVLRCGPSRGSFIQIYFYLFIFSIKFFLPSTRAIMQSF